MSNSVAIQRLASDHNGSFTIGMAAAAGIPRSAIEHEHRVG
ncbi:MAG: type IV toxin-antitoxin system AbiEi family antitoxin domain-containing protein, partial [Acidimicrobiia bacterium]|nr:type IV toxin-antitoxin system AbiEi family antitoxin domain-containing protein [Acidimicrobiia bacterium]